MNLPKIAFLFFVFLHSFVLSAAELLTAKSELKSGGETHTAGDVLELIVEVPGDFRLEELNPNFELNNLSYKKDDKTSVIPWNSGKILSWAKKEPRHFVFRFTAYKPGPLQIGPIVFEQHEQPVFQSQSYTVQFQTVLVQGVPPQKAELYPPQASSLPLWFYPLLGFFLIALGSMAYVGIQRWSARKELPLPGIELPPLEPFERFIKAQEKIMHQQFLQQNKYKPFYFAHSELCKQFLVWSCGIPAEEKTTHEILTLMQGVKTLHPFIEDWKQIFEALDLVKFTDSTPTEQEARQLAEKMKESARTLAALCVQGSQHGP